MREGGREMGEEKLVCRVIFVESTSGLTQNKSVIQNFRKANQ